MMVYFTDHELEVLDSILADAHDGDYDVLGDDLSDLLNSMTLGNYDQTKRRILEKTDRHVTLCHLRKRIRVLVDDVDE